LKKAALARLTCLAAIVAAGALPIAAQGQAPGRGGPPPPDPKKPQKLEITAGTKARYKVTEQLAGISFPSDAVGTTEAITGSIVINPDGSIAMFGLTKPTLARLVSVDDKIHLEIEFRCARTAM
jgi:hypothetical protein